MRSRLNVFHKKNALVREVADVGEALPSLTDAGGYLLNRK